MPGWVEGFFIFYGLPILLTGMIIVGAASVTLSCLVGNFGYAILP